MAINDTTYQSPTYTKFAEKVNETDYLYWEDWIEKWESLRNCAEMVSWLHILFDTRSKTHSSSLRITRDQLIFCLDIARNHWGCRYMSETQSAWDATTPREVIKKAASLLITGWFNTGSEKRDDFETWFLTKGRVLIEEGVILGIFAMIKEGEKSDYKAPYFLKNHEQAILLKFLTFLALLPWSNDWMSNRALSEDQQKLIHRFRPEFIKLLVDLREVDKLVGRRDAVSLDDLKILRKIVFGKTYDWITPPSSFGEAIGLHSRNQAAETLLVLEASVKFVERKNKKLGRLEGQLQKLSDECESISDEMAKLESAIEVAKRVICAAPPELEDKLAGLIEQRNALIGKISGVKSEIERIEGRR